MSTPNQKKIILNRSSLDSKKGKVIIDADLIMLASSKLNLAGLRVYLYLLTIVPDTYNGIKNEKNTRIKEFELSPQAIENKYNIDHSCIRRGISNLIDKGYLIPMPNFSNTYQFIDILPEDKTLTPEDAEKIYTYTDLLEQSINSLKDSREEQLHKVAEKYVQTNHPWE